jgi:hypothetical protein
MAWYGKEYKNAPVERGRYEMKLRRAYIRPTPWLMEEQEEEGEQERI